ncbi:MAG: ABC transporter ATP-binding protein [Pseudomonadota bacterium]
MIETHQLEKHYGVLRAVDGVSFKVEPGEVLGFLGPNGAGKSTTMKMLAGFVTPTRGKALIDGLNVVDHPVACKQRIGYLPEGAPAYGEMIPLDFLRFIGQVRGMDADQARRRIDEVVAELHLEPVLHQTIDTLSKGFKRRVGLAQAILHDPGILILDEPTDGLDPNQKHEVRQLIQRMAADKTIIVSTHILEEVSAVCTRAIIIARGKILADSTPSQLKAQAPGHNELLLKPVDDHQLDGFAAALRAQTTVDKVSREKGCLRVVPAAGQNLLADVAALAKDRGIVLESAQLLEGQLDEVFRTITLADKERS